MRYDIYIYDIRRLKVNQPGMRFQLWPLQETLYAAETCSRLELNIC